MPCLLEIDEKNICSNKIVTIPWGIVSWNLVIVPKHTFHMSSPIATFVDVVLLDNPSKYLNNNFANDNIGIEHITITKQIEDIVVDNGNNILNECLQLYGWAPKLLAAQYMLHCMRTCDFLDYRYKNYIVLNCTSGIVDEIKEFPKIALNSNFRNNSYLFQSLFIDKKDILTYTKLTKQGLKTFLAQCCLEKSRNNLPQFFDIFNSARIWYRPINK